MNKESSEANNIPGDVLVFVYPLIQAFPILPPNRVWPGRLDEVPPTQSQKLTSPASFGWRGFLVFGVSLGRAAGAVLP